MVVLFLLTRFVEISYKYFFSFVFFRSILNLHNSLFLTYLLNSLFLGAFMCSEGKGNLKFLICFDF